MRKIPNRFSLIETAAGLQAGARARLLAIMREEHPAIDTRAQFQNMCVAAFTIMNLPVRKLADDMALSPSSVYRWARGETVPHPILWPNIRDWIMTELQAGLQTYPEFKEANDAA